MNQFIKLSTVSALALATSLAWSKGAITKIVVESQALRAPVEIVDPTILEKFTIWSGPGVGGWDMLNTVPRREDPKFIVDWKRGIVNTPPAGPARYLVRMYIEGRQSPQNTYEVEYAVDPADNLGYVYLPGYREEFGRWNTFQIYRGVEGNWFKATSEWEGVVRPLIDRK